MSSADYYYKLIFFQSSDWSWLPGESRKKWVANLQQSIEWIQHLSTAIASINGIHLWSMMKLIGGGFNGLDEGQDNANPKQIENKQTKTW